MKKKDILDIIVSRKGVILYEKFNSRDSLILKPGIGFFFSFFFFLKDEFYSTLKGKGGR